MFLWNDVINFVIEKCDVTLVKQTILASLPCPFDYQLAQIGRKITGHELRRNC